MKIKRALIIGITAVALIVTAVIIVKSIKDKDSKKSNEYMTEEINELNKQDNTIENGSSLRIGNETYSVIGTDTKITLFIKKYKKSKVEMTVRYGYDTDGNLREQIDKNSEYIFDNEKPLNELDLNVIDKSIKVRSIAYDKDGNTFREGNITVDNLVNLNVYDIEISRTEENIKNVEFAFGIKFDTPKNEIESILSEQNRKDRRLKFVSNDKIIQVNYDRGIFSYIIEMKFLDEELINYRVYRELKNYS